MPLALGAFVVPLIVACALFMENVDSTVLVTALPVMARELGHDPITLKLAVTSYVVGLGVFIPICGWVADRYGSRTVFRSAIITFVVGSMLCAAAHSLTMLVLARFLQGVGGAMMVPVGRIIIFRSVPRAEFVRAVTYLTVPALLGPLVGPLLGGFIATYLNWRLMFFINAPIGLLGIYLTNRYIANTREPDPGRLDVAGFVLSGVGATLFMLGMSLLGSGLVHDGSAAAMGLGGVVVVLVYVLYAQRAERPLLDLRFFRIPTFHCSVIGGSLFRISLGSMPFLLPLALQEGLGMSPFASGTMTCATALGGLCMKTVAVRTLRRFGFRSVLMVNALLSGIGLAVCGIFHPGMPLWGIWVVVLLGGFFPALQFTCLNALAYADIESRDVGRATSVGSVVQQISLGLGVTVAGLALQVSHSVQGHGQIVWTDFWPVFLLMGLFSVASIFITARMLLGAGGSVARGH